MDDFRSVLEDLDWLRQEWWEGQGATLTDGHIRRGSAALHLLLVEKLIGRAWRNFGFTGEPSFDGPDIVELAAQYGLRLDMGVSVVAGGGRIKDVDLAFIGGFRTDNPQTGVPADAEQGFAVCMTSTMRDARSAVPNELDQLVHRRWRLTEYLESPGAIRKGEIIKRREVVDYFRNYVGGAHHDLLKVATNSKTERHELTRDLERHVRADTRDGLYFELLSIGQSVGRSADMAALVAKIKSMPAS